jgi:hypothetical protein
MYSKFISAIVAVSAQAQIVPGDDGRIFSTNLDGVDIDSILGATAGDINVSGDDYFETFNNAIGEAFQAPEYVYEDVGPQDDTLPDYIYYGDYDGTANQAIEVAVSQPATEQASAGRPMSADDQAATGNQTRDLNTGINKPTGWDTATGFNTCRVCKGETAEACQTSNTFETCNDAQDACQVTIRSQYIGKNKLEAKYYSGCKQLAACNAEYSRNFFDDHSASAQQPMSVHDLCKAASWLPARFYRVSECTFCKKMASSADQNSQLFGTSTTQMYTHTDNNVAQFVAFSDILGFPRQHMADFFAVNDFYSLPSN